MPYGKQAPVPCGVRGHVNCEKGNSRDNSAVLHIWGTPSTTVLYKYSNKKGKEKKTAEIT